MGSLTSPPRVEYESGGSAPTYAALDRARSELDALHADNLAVEQRLRLIVEEYAAQIGTTTGRAFDYISDMMADLVFDREAEITNETTDLEDRLGDDA